MNMLPAKTFFDRKIRTWDPLRELLRMQEDMDRAFASLWRVGNGNQKAARAWVPSIEVFEDKNQFTVEAELPGVSKEDLSLNVSEDTVTLSGERKVRHEDKEASALLSEMVYGTFERAIPLGQPVKTDAVKAEFKDGILKITLPKAEQTRTREIKIEVK
jgi:HSP20 family protein